MTLQNRPTTKMGSLVSTPSAKFANELLGGGMVYQGVHWTQSEVDRLRKLYEYKVERPNKKPAPPVAPKRSDFNSDWDYRSAVSRHEDELRNHAKWQDSIALLQAGADRNMARYAEHDGLRIVAWLSRYAEPGEDPMKALIRLLMDSGIDIDPSDVTWAIGEEPQENRPDHSTKKKGKRK